MAILTLDLELYQHYTRKHNEHDDAAFRLRLRGDEYEYL
jgi:hypothetical protein